MSEFELMTYERVNSGTKKKPIHKKGYKLNINLGLKVYDIFARAVGVFFARASLFTGFSPFGLSFLAMERRFSLKSAITFIMVCVGSMLLGDISYSTKYISASAIYMLVLFVLERDRLLSTLASSVISGIILFGTGLTVMFWQDISVGNVLLLICECLAMMSGIFVFEKGQALLMDKKAMFKRLSDEEKLSLGVVFAVVILSLKNVYISSDMSISNIVSLTTVLIVSVSAGMGMSTVIGVFLGMLCGIGGDYFLPIVGALGFSGFMSGLLSKGKKAGAIAGLIIANAVLIVYINGAIDSMLSIYEIGMASVALCFVPKKVMRYTESLFKAEPEGAKNINRIKDLMEHKLSAVSKSFKTLAVTLKSLSDKQTGADISDISAMFDKAADKVCRTCKNATICWGKEFNSTYQTMFKFLEIMERRGYLEESDVSTYFRSRCIHLKNMIEELNKLFEIYKINTAWKNRLSESRDLVGEQLMGISKIMDRLAGEMDIDTNSDETSANQIYDMLCAKGLKVKNVYVVQDKDKRTNVELSLDIQRFENKYCSLVKNVSSTILKKTFEIKEVMQDNKAHLYRIKLSEEEVFAVDPGCVSRSASEKSGDNYMLIQLSEGKYVVVLSDGMGTGTRAAKESQAIIELLDSLLKTGFEKDVAVKLINSIMVIKSAQESFVTIDMCVVDLYTGEVEFIKTGAEPSYIKRNGDIEVVRSASLPVGVLPDMDVETFARKITVDDVLVMITDGIETKDAGDDWLREFLKEVDSEASAQKISEIILDKAIEENDGTVNDDMTAIVLKLNKRSAPALAE